MGEAKFRDGAGPFVFGKFLYVAVGADLYMYATCSVSSGRIPGGAGT